MWRKRLLVAGKVTLLSCLGAVIVFALDYACTGVMHGHLPPRELPGPYTIESRKFPGGLTTLKQIERNFGPPAEKSPDQRICIWVFLYRDGGVVGLRKRLYWKEMFASFGYRMYVARAAFDERGVLQGWQRDDYTIVTFPKREVGADDTPSLAVKSKTEVAAQAY
jgi:hypothetical protein